MVIDREHRAWRVRRGPCVRRAEPRSHRWPGQSLGTRNSRLPEQFLILIDCASEAEQLRLLTRFQTEGLRCRALIS
jgi:hypothetical protein